MIFIPTLSNSGHIESSLCQECAKRGFATDSDIAKTHGYTITSDEVYAHQDFLGQDGDLTDFELELISGGQERKAGC